MDKICWYNLATNPRAIHLIEQNMDKILCDYIECLSENPNAIHLLEAYLLEHKLSGRINYLNYRSEHKPSEPNLNCLSENPNAISLLEQYRNIIDWELLSVNPSIFEIDIKQLKLDISEKANIIDMLI